MKKSNVITMGGVATIAALVLSACGNGDVVADCVLAEEQPDDSYQVVDDRFCNSGSHGAYVYMYGGTGSGGYVRGGTTLKPSNSSIVTRSGHVVQRGGFGGRGGGGGS